MIQGLFEDFFGGFYYCILAVCSLLSMLYFFKASIPFRWLAALICLTLFSELIAKFFSFELEMSNSIVYHFFTPVEYFIYVRIFSHFLGEHQWKSMLWASVAFLVVIEILNTCLWQTFQDTNTNVMILESLFLVILSLLLFLKIREQPFRKILVSEGIFWFCSAVLCYYSFNILVWGFHNMKVYLLENPPDIIYNFNLILSSLLYLTYTMAIVMDAYVKQRSGSLPQ